MNRTTTLTAPTRTLSVRLLAVLLLTLALATAAGAVAPPAGAATTPGVQATPNNDGWHPWYENGCTAVPDWGWLSGSRFNFGHACGHHDGCYRNHWASRATCDKWFLNDMYASCRAANPWWRSKWGCYKVAGAYYLGVRQYGDWFYNNRSVSARMHYYA